MKTLRSHEGYFLVDHRQSPGLSEEQVLAQGLPPGAAHGIFEAPTYTCGHCNAVVVMHPDRQRARAVCFDCFQRICDGCEAIRQRTLQCHSMARVIEHVIEQTLKET